MADRTGFTRREFLKTASAAIAVPYVITSSALGADERPPASERIVMGGIGIGNMGRGDLGAFLGRGDVQYVAVCDVRKGVRDAGQRQGRRALREQRLQGLQRLPRTAGPRRHRRRARRHARPLARDHRHRGLPQRQGRLLPEARDAARLREGPLMVEAARRYGRVVSGGSQRVLEDYRKMVDQCWGGELGTIKSINVNVGPLSQPCNLPAEPVPDGIDWDMWLGPAPWAPYNGNRCSGSFATNGNSWRSYSDYSGGGMTDWGAHHFGGATFAVDVRELQPEEVIYHDEDGKQVPDLPLSQRHC